MKILGIDPGTATTGFGVIVTHQIFYLDHLSVFAIPLWLYVDHLLGPFFLLLLSALFLKFPL